MISSRSAPVQRFLFSPFSSTVTFERSCWKSDKKSLNSYVKYAKDTFIYHVNHVVFDRLKSTSVDSARACTTRLMASMKNSYASLFPMYCATIDGNKTVFDDKKKREKDREK